LWIAENYTYAEREKKFDLSLSDRVLIFEDRDGDGKPEKRTVFFDQAKRLTGIEVGRGGLWLIAPPQLLFIPDANGDDIPDGPPQVILEGFDVPAENYHNFANGIKWGPDGWLYGRCGASAPGKVRRPDEAPEKAIPLAGGIWRYHPVHKIFEPLCHGTTNPWGHDFDANGECFFVNTVNGHLWHMIPGAHYRRPHTISPNPYVYEPMEMCADHWHWDTGKDWSDSRKLTPEHDKRGGGHAHSGCMIYHGEQWPEQYRGKLFTLNFHGRRVNVERLEKHKSGYIAKHEPDMLFAADPFFRGIDLTYGPDGSVYILDWSDTGECHENTGVHRNSGRIFRVTYGKPKATPTPDLTKWNEKQLLEQIEKPKNGWYARMAARQIVERFAIERDVTVALDQLFQSDSMETQFRAMQVIFQRQPFWDPKPHPKGRDVAILVSSLRWMTQRYPLDTPHGSVRVSQEITPDARARFAALSERVKRGAAAELRLAMASTLQRLPFEDRLTLASALLANAEDATDPNIPFLIWYGLIPVAEKDPMALVPLAVEGKIPKVREWITRRLAEMMPKNPKPIAALLEKVATASESVRRDVVVGLSAGLAGVRKLDAPEAWRAFSKEFTGEDAAKLKSLVQSLDVVFGDGRALDEVRKVALDGKADLNSRKAALQTLIDANVPEMRSVCEQLLKTRFLNTVALKGLIKFDEPAMGKLLAGSYRSFHPSERAYVIEALASRPTFAAELLELLGNGTIPRTELSASQARQIRGFENAILTKRLSEVWGEFRDSPKDKADLMAKLKSEFTPEALSKANRSEGRALFVKQCANCHKLFGQGGEIGPDLTGAGRKDIDYLLSNIVDPSAVVTKDFQMTKFTLTDGRSVNGIVVAETAAAVTVQTEKERQIIPKPDIEQRTASTVSLMPDGLLSQLKPEEIQQLFAYLMSETQVNLPAEKR
jgi:putative membrane-bound dehydrogenase-like protein